ncbi:MAG: hypothetical protein U0838_17545 [Chloroflexota bacterium]
MSIRHPRSLGRTARRLASIVAVAVLAGSILPMAAAVPLASTPLAPKALANTPAPASVTLAGSLQSEIGCGGDWDPACAASHLTNDAADDVWQGTFSLPAGDYEYKAALNDSWDENYGANAARAAPTSFSASAARPP